MTWTEAGAVEAIERWFRTALRAVDPVTAVTSHLRFEQGTLLVDDVSVPVHGRLIVVAVGKAASGMARGAVAACRDAVGDGIILTKDGHLGSPVLERFEAYEAAHPIPDARGVTATERILDVVADTAPGDVLLVLLSGGGSALLEAPGTGVTLADVATTTDLLLKAGAPIQHLNAVRVPLSRVKGGGLRRAAPQARFVTLLLSDVLGNDPHVIASGPTVPTEFTTTNALHVLDRYDLRERVPRSVVDSLGSTPASSDDGIFAGDVVITVGDNAAAVDAFAAAAAADGVRARTIWTAREGEARELAIQWVSACLAAVPDARLLLGGGEATVSVRGDGIGGRNTELALAAALELERRNNRDWVVASLATDGQDGLTGVAGAIATPSTLARARADGVDPVACLERNDSLEVFKRTGGAVVTGPTGTNVNDVYVALRLG